ATGIVMDHGLIVEVADIKCAIGADARFDWPEPHVAAADEFGLTCFLSEVAVVPFCRPGAAVVDGATSGGGERTDEINLHVGLLVVADQRIRFAADNLGLVTAGPGDLAAGEG